MKKVLFAGAVAVLIVGCQTDNKSSDTGAEETADVNSISYSLGVLMGSQLKGNVDELQYSDYLAGFKAGFQTELEEEQLGLASKKLQDYQKERQARLGQAAVAEGDAFRAENAKKEGVKVTESGLQYEVLQAGKGDKPTAADKVTVHYKGALITGEEFDSSLKRGQPATFGLGGVIKGWTEGLQLMSKGAKYKFVIPPELAYGERGAGGTIGPNATLVFEVELIEIEKAGEEAK